MRRTAPGKARRAGEDIIDFGMGNPDMPTPQHIVEKLIEAAHNPRNHRYSLSKGIPKLRGAIADWYKKRFDVDIDPDTGKLSLSKKVLMEGYKEEEHQGEKREHRRPRPERHERHDRRRQ